MNGKFRLSQAGCLKQAYNLLRKSDRRRPWRPKRASAQEEEKRTREATSEEEEQNRTERTRIRNKNYNTLYR